MPVTTATSGLSSQVSYAVTLEAKGRWKMELPNKMFHLASVIQTTQKAQALGEHQQSKVSLELKIT